MTEKRRENAELIPIDTDDLLIEIGCEELPPKALDALREALFTNVSKLLAQENIEFDSAASKAFSTPRRLALLFRAVLARQTDKIQERRGPALSAAFDATGQATPAALGFARSVGMDVGDLNHIETDKGGWLAARIEIPGKPLSELIFPVLEQALHQLPIPRPMRWSDHEFSFIRPVHWLVVLHGDRVLPGSLLGQSASNTTRGHRVHAPGPHKLGCARDYLNTLKAARVLVDQDERKARIKDQLLRINTATRIEPALLAEVNNLVEWPVAISCTFAEDFLALPHDALVASMRDHQRFFPVDNTEDTSRVTNQFIAVANLESADVEQVRKGFERVIRPRLADAQFFLEQDQKQALEDYFPSLEKVVFQKHIGTLGDKSKRLTRISTKLAEYLSLTDSASIRAAHLCKCDLMTQMVGEFPQLQGRMGRHYALHCGEPLAVADAIEEHYHPRFSGDQIPASKAGQILSLADRADTLIAIFSVGLQPTGSKDPFALRRAALGLVRILLEAKLDIPVAHILELAVNELTHQDMEIDATTAAAVHTFVTQRAVNHFRDTGHDTGLVHAAMASNWQTFPDLQARLTALTGFLGLESGISLAAANKRISNILRKSNQGDFEIINEDRLDLEEEKHLFEEVTNTECALKPLLKSNNYAAYLEQLSHLRHPVDRFFDAVMVMDEDRVLRNNRLALLSHIKGLFDQVADLSVLG